MLMPAMSKTTFLFVALSGNVTEALPLGTAGGLQFPGLEKFELTAPVHDCARASLAAIREIAPSATAMRRKLCLTAAASFPWCAGVSGRLATAANANRRSTYRRNDEMVHRELRSTDSRSRPRNAVAARSLVDETWCISTPRRLGVADTINQRATHSAQLDVRPGCFGRVAGDADNIEWCANPKPGRCSRCRPRPARVSHTTVRPRDSRRALQI